MPKPTGGPLWWMNNTEVSVGCRDNSAQADTECDAHCKNQAKYFEDTYDLSFRPLPEVVSILQSYNNNNILSIIHHCAGKGIA